MRGGIALMLRVSSQGRWGAAECGAADGYLTLFHLISPTPICFMRDRHSGSFILLTLVYKKDKGSGCHR